MGTVIRVDKRARSFADTLAAAAAGEYRALESLAVMCLPKLTSFAEARGASDPDGIANTVMMEFFQRLDGLSFEAPAQMWSYLYHIARSRVIDERRATKPVEYHERQAIEHLMAPAAEFDERVADRQYVDGLLSELTSDQREVLEMRFLDDLSIEETASRTGRTLTAVKGLQRRAIRALSTAAALIALILVAGLVWAVLDDDPRISMISERPLEPAADGTTTGTSGRVDAGVTIGPSDYVAPSSVITEMVGDEDDPRSVTFHFGADDDLSGVAGFECRLDGGDFTVCASPIRYEDLGDGSHVFEVRAIDLAHNREQTPASWVWTVEIEQPEGAPPGVDVAALRRSDAELKCAGVRGTWADIEAKGYDVMVGTEGDDLIDVSGGDRPDFVLAYDGNDSVITGGGDDVICGGGGNDTIESGGGEDRVGGGGGNDTILTGSQNDRIWAGSGNDTIDAGAGDDQVKGEGGIDIIHGRAGDDRLMGNADLDVLMGGDGHDTCEPESADAPIGEGCEAAPEPPPEKAP